MSVHYKFKNALDYSTITFDGIHISVADLKKAIIDQERLGKSVDSDLQITNSQTKEVYETEDSLIPKNTSVIVARVPVVADKRRSANGPATFGPGGSQGPFQRHQRNPPPAAQPSAVAKGVDLATFEGTEDEKIQAMMSQSTADYDPSNYLRVRGQTQHGRVPPQYRCYKCNHPGHWIKDCPLAGQGADASDGLRKSTGIPRSFMVVVDGPQVPGALITPEGRYAVPAVDHAAYMEKNKAHVEAPVVKPKIPEELLCNLCNDLLTDALLVPCCANSYCDECIRNILLESEEQECPGCHEKEISPNSLIPNRFLRTAVNAFKNETGYSKPAKVIEAPARVPPTVDLTSSKPDRVRKLSLDDLPEDLFPHSPRRPSESEKEEKNSESDDKTDLYDFNDGSLPSTFSSGQTPTDQSEKENSIKTINASQSQKSYGGHNQNQQHQPMRREPYRQQQARTPLHSGMPPLPGVNQHHPHYKSSMEPPPPGFEDASSGEGRSTPRDDRPTRTAPPLDGGDNRSQQQQPHHLGPPLMGGIPGFNPNQPPPGFSMPPPGMGGPPHGMYPGGPPGPMHPGSNYGMHPQYRGPAPGPGNRMYPGRGHPDDRYSRDRDRSQRPRYPPRERDRMSRERSDRREEPHISGAIEDPLKEFERIMREKDRRKEMAAAAAAAGTAVKRDRSLSFSPGRSPPSPFVKRDRSFSRSPSPKRLRVVVRRRKSYSRSGSRSPISSHPPRRAARSRSRSRNRSPSPLPQLLPSLAKRRSPRRAPPYSPSPPPSRFPPRKHDKVDYHEARPRYDPPPTRYAQSTTKPYERERSERERHSREHDKKYEAHPKYASTKYDHPPPPKYDVTKKYDSKYEPSSKYDQGRSSSRSRYPHEADRAHGAYERDRELRHFEFDGSVLPPGTEPPQAPPSLFDLNLGNPEQQGYSKAPIGDPAYYNKGPQTEKVLRHRDLESLSITPDSERGGTKETRERRRRSAEAKVEEAPKVEKKVKKEKKKHKKKTREEKDKKSKRRKSKTDKSEEHSAKAETGDEEEEAASDSATGSRRNSGEAEPETGDPTAGVICDSTVKSPERHKDSEAPLLGLHVEVKNDLGYENENGHSSDTIQPGKDKDDKPVTRVEEEVAVPAVPIPPSKWDKDEDESDGPPGEVGQPIETLVHGQGRAEEAQDEKKVTSEVIKRAESALFGKAAASRMTESKKQSPKRKSEKLAEAEEPKEKVKTKDAEAKRDRDRERDRDRDRERGRDRSREAKPIPNIQVTVLEAATAPTAEPPVKRSVRDRLGSKVEESSSRRSRDRSRDKVTVRSEVSTSKRDLRRDAGRRSRSPISLSRRRSRSRPPIRRDSRTRDREARPRADRARDDRPRTDSRTTTIRRRSRSKQKSKSRDRRRTRSPPRVASEVAPTRRRSRSRDRTHRARDEAKPEERRPEKTKVAEKLLKPLVAADVFERSTPPPSSKGGEGDKKSAPVPLAERKQKRINIKLSASSSKVEAESSSSSEPEPEVEAAAAAAAGTRTTSIETDEEKKKRKEKKTKLKRRKSKDSTSSSSVAEKKSKKKKKKKSKKRKNKA